MKTMTLLLISLLLITSTSSYADECAYDPNANTGGCPYVCPPASGFLQSSGATSNAWYGVDADVKDEVVNCPPNVKQPCGSFGDFKNKPNSFTSSKIDMSGKTIYCYYDNATGYYDPQVQLNIDIASTSVKCDYVGLSPGTTSCKGDDSLRCPILCKTPATAGATQ